MPRSLLKQKDISGAIQAINSLLPYLHKMPPEERYTTLALRLFKLLDELEKRRGLYDRSGST